MAYVIKDEKGNPRRFKGHTNIYGMDYFGSRAEFKDFNDRERSF